METNKENAIEWYTGGNIATLSLTSRRHITKVKKLATTHPNEVEIVENPDGSLFAHVPLSYIKISAPRQMSEEQKQKAADRLRKTRVKKERDGVDKEDIN